MSLHGFQRDPRELAEPSWRMLDRAVWRWVRSHGGSPLLAEVAAWASLADSHGDTALPLNGEGAGRHGMRVLAPEALAALRAEPMVGDGARVPATPTPFVLDAAGRFYLWRNHRHERDVATLLHARRRDRTTHLPAQADSLLAADLDALFHHDRSSAVQPQRRAVAQVGGRRLFVLTGGPGTGKTTTVLRMLLMLQRQAAAPLTVAVAAPTGKAAQRLVQSLRHGKERLLNDAHAPLPADWQPLLDRIPEGEALTLHRLLAFDPRRGVFRRGPREPIAADVVVVDEASMVDLAMLHALLGAVRADATLVLVGDADQLTSVGAGSVLMDLVTAMEAEGGDDLVRLEHSFRAEQQLVPINQSVRAGDGRAFAGALAAAGAAVQHRHVADAAALQPVLRQWADAIAADAELRPQLPSAGADADPAPAVLAALRALARRQLLCALREDAFGALALNAQIERQLRRQWAVAEETAWYPGRAVIITRNDYAARLFNGDVGLCLADADGQLRVWFETVDDDGRPAVRGVLPTTLPAHEGGFAITIHKSQGSEYACAAVVLPPDAEHRILSRQLLYTGVSRAKQALQLWAAPAALDAALARQVQRVGGLVERLQGECAGAQGAPGGE